MSSPAVTKESPTLNLDALRRRLARHPFAPHPVWRNGHAQTIAGFLARYLPQRRTQLRRESATDEVRLFEVEPGVRLLAHCRWQQARKQRPTLLLLHGLEGSSESGYMLGTASKAYRAGFNTLRVNMRNCGATEHLTQTLYHSGMSGDMLAIVNELIKSDELPSIFLVGFSMGGNIVLKLGGEAGDAAPSELHGICAVSPSLDLSRCARAIELPSNRIYQRRFVRSLHRRMRRKQQLYPHLYDTADLSRVRTVRDFDNRYTAPHAGYRDAEDYYQQASAVRFLADARCPTLIIHAQDDPFVPFASFTNPNISENENIILLAPERGGHVGFIGAKQSGEDRFWAENRVVEFCSTLLADRKELLVR